MELGIALFVLACLAVNVTRVFIPHLYTDGTFLAIPARLMLGVAVLVCAMNVLLRFFPGTSSSWVIVVGLAVLGLARLKADWRGFGSGTQRQAKICLLVFVVGMLLWRLFGQLHRGALTPIEGTGNSDELWYIFTADWLRTHSLAAPFTDNPAYPLAAAAGVNLGLLPRIGAETLLVLFSTVGQTPIEQVYPLIFAIAAVCFGFSAIQGLMPEVERNWKFLPLALLGVAISPVALFIYGNENFATMWGLVFLAGYYWHLQAALRHEAGGRGSAAAAGVFLGALLATYPELLAIAGPATVLLCAATFVRERSAWQRAVGMPALSTLVAVVVAPYAALGAFHVLATGASAAQGPNVIYPDLFAKMSPSTLVTTLLLFDNKLLTTFVGSAGPAIGSVVLVFGLLFAPKRVWQATGALALACLPVLAMFWRANYGYGGMKAIEFMALPATIRMSATAGRLALALGRGAQRAHDAAPGPRAWRFAHGAVAVLAILLLGATAAGRWYKFRQYGESAYLTASLRDVASASAVLPPDALLQVGPELGSHAFLFSRWVAYFLPKVALLYPPELHNGGYIYRLEADYPARLAKVTHVLKARNNEGGLSSNAVWRNDEFEIIPFARMPFTLGKGFHGHEGWGRWMADTAEIELNGNCARQLQVRVGRRFEPLKGDDALIVSAGDVSKRFPLHGGTGEITFDVPAGASHVVLRSAAGGMSPTAIGANDDRILSYGIEKIGIDACPHP